MIFKKKAKRIPCVFMVCALLFVSVFVCSYAANASDKFTPRLTAPSYSDNHYYSGDNIFYKYGYGMPNCTAYAWGRAYELLGKTPTLCRYNAEEWYNYTVDGYERGLTPKLGAIACWYYYYGDGEIAGHVAVVEKIENNKITFSNSAWGWQEFYLTEASVYDDNPGQSNWIFQGYIYIGDFENGNPIDSTDPKPTDDPISTTPTTPTPDPFTYSKGKYIVDVDDYLNIRGNATTSSQIVGQLYSGNEIIVTEIKENDGYTWGKFTFGNNKTGWIALEFCEYVGKYEPDDFKMGDVDLDGEVTVSDITKVQLYLANQVTFNDTQIGLADYDYNGLIDVFDVTAIQIDLAKVSS